MSHAQEVTSTPGDVSNRGNASAMSDKLSNLRPKVALELDHPF